MNTDKSKEFTNKAMADKIAQRRDKSVYLLGKNKQGNNVYFVGDYKDAIKKTATYSASTNGTRDSRLPKRK
jgi:hypothetical protein